MPVVSWSLSVLVLLSALYHMPSCAVRGLHAPAKFSCQHSCVLLLICYASHSTPSLRRAVAHTPPHLGRSRAAHVFAPPYIALLLWVSSSCLGPGFTCCPLSWLFPTLTVNCVGGGKLKVEGGRTLLSWGWLEAWTVRPCIWGCCVICCRCCSRVAGPFEDSMQHLCCRSAVLEIASSPRVFVHALHEVHSMHGCLVLQLDA